MIALAGLARDGAAGRARAADLLARGEGAACFARFVAAQGGDVAIVEHPGRLPRAAVTRSVRAERSGFVGSLAARALGEGAALLGCGRGALASAVDPAAGMLLTVARGDSVRAGDEIALLHAASEARIAAAMPLVAAAIPIGDAPPSPSPASPILAVMSN